MIYFQKVCQRLLSLSLLFLLVTTLTFGLKSPPSWATTPIQSTMSLFPNPLATMSQWEIMSKNQEGNAEEAETAAIAEAKRFKAATIKGMNNSIVNPAYQPDGKTEKLEKQDNQDMKDIKAEARNVFDKS